MKKVLLGILLNFSITLSQLSFSPIANAADVVTILNSQSVIGSVETVPNIWKGDVPTKVGFPSGTFSQKLEFPIQGLLPYSTLADRATGVEVEFEVWSQSGKKIAYDTVYSFDWNPVGPNTLVSMYLSESDAAGNHTLLIRTIYELSTTGLLTRYLKSEIKIPLQIAIYSKPGNISSMTTKWENESITYSFTLSDNNSSQDYFEVGFQYLLNTTADKSKYANYSPVYVIKKTTGNSFQLTYEEIIKWLKEKNLDVDKSTVMVRARGVNNWGVGEWGYGLYTDTTNFNRYYQNIAAARAKAEAEEKAKAEAEANARAQAELQAKLPKKVSNLKGTRTSFGLEYEFLPAEVTPRYEFEVGISRILIYGADVTRSSNYGSETIIKSVTGTSFALSLEEIKNYLESEGQDISKSTFLIKVRGKNEFGVGEWSSGVYTKTEELFPSTSKKVTITCVKGKKTKKVTGSNPKCPAGYKRK